MQFSVTHNLLHAAASFIMSTRRCRCRQCLANISVPLSCFLLSDLLPIKGDIRSLKHGQLVINEQRMFETTPVIRLYDRSNEDV